MEKRGSCFVGHRFRIGRGGLHGPQSGKAGIALVSRMDGVKIGWFVLSGFLGTNLKCLP